MHKEQNVDCLIVNVKSLNVIFIEHNYWGMVVL